MGLIAIRDAATVGDLSRCRVEAEHLHNLPSFISEQDKQRHLYYVIAEKTAYLEWILRVSAPARRGKLPLR